MSRLILPLFFGILGTSILLWLGFWQVERLAEKEAYLTAIDARIGAAPEALPTAPNAERDRFMPVETSGRYTGEMLHVLASTREVGAVYRIIAAFETDAGRRVMVDRGWVKTARKTEVVSDGAASVTGNLHWPDERDSYTPENDVTGNIWFARDVDVMAGALNTEPLLIVAKAETGPASEKGASVTPLPVDSAGIPNDHLQYAVTWFGLAIVWVAMTLYYLRRMRKTKKA